MERINVAVRARPLSPEDARKSPWRISGNSILLANSDIKFDFNRIFREDCRTVDIYESRTKYIVSAAIGGFNGTVFAYGQTNSGKTHTMRGSSVEPGVIPLAVHDLFDMIQQQMDREFLLRMSYMEIYNEEINDLLAPEHRKLEIHESIERGIFVAGLREEIVTSPNQVLEFITFGEAHRHIGETNLNLHSRSHTIFRMIIESSDRAEDEHADAVRVSVLNLVDLAGSERAVESRAEGVRLKEVSHINKSLMTLGTVIRRLSEGVKSQGGHVPYRDSKLTRILQPSLGGNANTAIICTITLAQIHADETKRSLYFARQALSVTNYVRVNEIVTDSALLKRQKKEIEELRAKLQGSPPVHLGEETVKLRNTLLQSDLERERIALELEEEKKAQAERDAESMMDEHLQSCTASTADQEDARSFSSIDFIQIKKPRLSDYEKVHSCMKATVDEAELEKVRKELEACREECKVITDKLHLTEEKLQVEKAHSVEKSVEIERLRNHIRLLDDQKRFTENKLQNQLLQVTKQRDEAMAKAEQVRDVKQLSMEGCNDKMAAEINQEFTILYQVGDLRKGRLTIPSWFVRMHRLDTYKSCLLLFDGQHYKMKLQVYKDTRIRATPGNVVIMGNFNFFKHANIRLKVILDLDDKREDSSVIFNVTEFG